MRRRILFLVFAGLLSGAAPAQALTIREIIELSKGGLGDEVLIALIEMERRVFPVDADTLKAVKEAGVSDKVILALVRSGRMPAAEPSAPAAPAPQAEVPRAEPQVIVVDHHHHDDRPVVQPVAVPVPVYVPVVVVPRRPWPGATVDTPPFSTVGLPHPRLGLSAPPAKPTSDPPYWKQQQRQRNK